MSTTEQILAALALQQPLLDQPDLGDHNTAEEVWDAWAPAHAVVELPRAAEDLIDRASISLGHCAGTGWQRPYAWQCVEAAAWGRARPLPMPTSPNGLMPAQKGRGPVLGKIASLLARRRRQHARQTPSANQHQQGGRRA